MEEPKLNISLEIDFDMWFYLLDNPFSLNPTIWKIVFEYLSLNQRNQISELFKIKKASYILIQLRFNDEGLKIKTLYKEYYN